MDKPRVYDAMWFGALPISDQDLLGALYDQAKQLRKVCPVRYVGITDPGHPPFKHNDDCICHGTGLIPIGPEDIHLEDMVAALQTIQHCMVPEFVAERAKKALNGIQCSEDVEVRVKG